MRGPLGAVVGTLPAAAPAEAGVRIIDDDGDGDGTSGTGGGYTFTGTGTDVTEGETATVTFTVSPAPDAADTVTLAYATAGNSLARPGIDFTPVSGSVTFTASSMSAQVQVDTIDDPHNELSESFLVRLGVPGGGTADAPVTIHDNDSPATGNIPGGDPCCGPFEDPVTPINRNCAPGSHGHNEPGGRGFYCHDTHTGPGGCADLLQVGTDSDHNWWHEDPCPPPGTPPECPWSFHDHRGYCHYHELAPTTCLPGRSQHWREHHYTPRFHHRARTTLACPPPSSSLLGDVDGGLSRLVVHAGDYLVLQITVDVSSPHVYKTRTLLVEIAAGCAAARQGPGEVTEPDDCGGANIHYTPIYRTLTFTTSGTQQVDLKTLVDTGHGTKSRKVVFKITDRVHPEMAPVYRSAWISPPLRGSQ